MEFGITHDTLNIPIDYYIQIYEKGYYEIQPDESIPHFEEVYKSVMHTLGRLSEILPPTTYLEKIVKIMISNHMIISATEDKPYFILHTYFLNNLTFSCCDILDFKAFVITNIRYNIIRNIMSSQLFHFLLIAHPDRFVLCENDGDVFQLLSSISSTDGHGGPMKIDGRNTDLIDINKINISIIPKFIIKNYLMYNWLCPHFESVSRYRRPCLVFDVSRRNVQMARDELWMIHVLITNESLGEHTYPLSSMVDLNNENYSTMMLYPIIYDESYEIKTNRDLSTDIFIPEIHHQILYSEEHGYTNWFINQNPGGFHSQGYIGNIEDEKLFSILVELSTYDSEVKIEMKHINVSKLNIEIETAPKYEGDDGVECSVCMDMIKNNYIICSKCKTIVCRSCFDKCNECSIRCGSNDFVFYN